LKVTRMAVAGGVMAPHASFSLGRRWPAKPVG
jgi:hypothetical protein